jgi:hypothetical protein
MQKQKINYQSSGHRPSRFLVDLPSLTNDTKNEKKKVNIYLRKFFSFNKARARKSNNKKIYERLFIYEMIKGVFVLFRKALYVFTVFAFVWKVLKKHKASLKLKRIKQTKENKEDYFVPKIEEKIVEEIHDSKYVTNNESKQGFFRRVFSLLRPAITFAIIVSFLILPFKAWLELSNVNALEGRVMGIAEMAISDVMDGGESIKLMDFKAAEASFKSAKSALLKAEDEISWLANAANIVNQIIPQEKTLLAEQASLLIEAGVLGTDLATHVSHTLAEISVAKGQNTSEVIKRVDLYLESIEDTNYALALTLKKINPEIIPTDYRTVIDDAKNKGELLTESVNEFIALFKVVKNVLGFDYDTRHLLVFQNNSELRASGGFIGSYALMDFHNAEIKSLEVPSGGGYDTEAGLYEMLLSPEPLQLLKSRWYFWDANWWPDWEISASKLAWFLEKSNGPTVDGVISFTPTFIENLLSISGPIRIGGDFNIEISNENFYTTIQSIVEDKNLYPHASSTLSGEKPKPKEIIGELFNAMLEQIPERLDQDMIIEMAQLLINNLLEKQILLYFSDADNQKVISQLDWAGEQKSSNGDYLMVVNTNLGGGKSDRKIADTYELESAIMNDGSIENILKINRQHMAYKNEPLVGVRNVDWLRVYVPEGAILLEADGFVLPDESFFKNPPDYLIEDSYIAETEALAIVHKSGAKIYNENNKTVFANWLVLDPGESRTVVLRYRLPKKVSTNDNYELLVQKQPGSVNASFYYSLLPSSGMELIDDTGVIYTSKDVFGFRSGLEKDRNIQLRIKN